MNVLLLGADGFLGRHLQIALETAGHTVRRGVHRPVRRADEIAVDYARDVDPGAWRGRLTGFDAVITGRIGRLAIWPSIRLLTPVESIHEGRLHDDPFEV
jgi:uncharacterized protein YbjT (DUF2867 family)